MTILGTTPCSVDWAEVAKVFAALMTPVIAVVAVLIAYQQYVVNRRQHRLALLERRMVFDSVMDCIAQVIQAPRGPSLDVLFTLLRKSREHDFLFGPEIGEYINDVYRNGLRLETDGAVGQPLNQETLNWFQGQNAIATKKFMKYIDFRKP
jgi:hypothetical protein